MRSPTSQCVRSSDKDCQRRLSATLLVVCFVVAFVVPLLTITAPTVSANPGWWNSSWTKRRPITITIPNWYSSNWLYRKQITIDSAKVENENFSNFPVLVSLTDLDLAAHVGVDNGDDILFTASNGTTKLAHEIENFDKVTGTLVAWISVPTLYDNENTYIYMYYGNSSATNQENKAGVWDDNFVMVQHLRDNSTSTTLDSTGNANHGRKKAANEPIEADGKIARAQNFDGGNDYDNIPDANSLDFTNAMTVMAWVRADTLPAEWIGIVAKDGYVDDEFAAWSLWANYGNDTHGFHPAFFFREEDGLAWARNLTLQTGQWYHLAATYDGTYTRLYVNGVLENTADPVTDLIEVTNYPLYIGSDARSGIPQHFFDGTIDEVRLSNKARSAGWIKTSYNNQSSPSTFYSLGDEYPPENYQLKIVISYDNDMRSDYGDLRFTEDDTGPELSYWIENYTADNVTVWVRRLESTDNTIYVYYSNPSATSESDGHATFIGFSDFESGSLDGWVNVDMTSMASSTDTALVGNSSLKGYKTSGFVPPAGAYKDVALPGTYIVDAGIRFESVGYYNDFFFGVYYSGTPSGGYGAAVRIYLTGVNDTMRYKLGTSASVSTGQTYTAGTWYRTRIVRKGTSSWELSYLSADGSTTIWENTNITYTPTNPLDRLGWMVDQDSSAIGYLDRILVRKYVSPEPTTSVGSEEEPPLLGRPQLLSPEDGSILTDNAPTFVWVMGENADNHRLLIDKDPDFSSPVVDNLLGASADNYTLTGAEALPDGTYYWKVVAINARGQTSSSIWTFTVRVTTIYAEDWVERAHVSRATIAFDALPSRYRGNLDESLLRAAAVAPDYWRLYGAESESTFTHSRDNAAYWLRCARDNYKENNYDNALYDMGIASYYIGDAMTLPRNDNIWENASKTSQYPSGWSLYRHFQEQARYYVPATPSPANWCPTLDDYINYMISYLDNYASRWESDWSYWVSTRDCGYVKSASDNATQLIYDAWYSLLYECIGSAGGGGGLGSALGVAGASDGGAVETRWSFGLLSFGFGAALFFTAVIFTRRSSLGGHRRRHCLRKDKRGVSPVVGAVLVFSILVIAGTTIVTHWIPELELKNEMDHTDAALDTWRKLQQAILNHENARIEVKLGADPASILGLFEQTPNPGTITVTPAKYVMRILPDDDAYVGDDGSSGSDLWVQTYKDNNRRAYIKFNLENLSADARIYEARLVMNAKISSFPHTWNGNTGYSPVPMLVAVMKVDDDSWSEGTISWATGYGDVLVNEDKPSENTWDISYEDDIGTWYTFNVSSYVKGQWTGGDNLISLCLKAPRENSSLKRYAWFRSKESAGYRPYLQITYESVSESWRSFDNWGSIADSGSVVFYVPNKRYDQYSFVFEDGALIKELYRENPILGVTNQEEYEPPQQSSSQTGGPIMVASPPLVVGQRLEGDNVKIYVNRYRIVNRATYTGTGKAFLNVTVQENADLRVEENLDNVMVAARSDRPQVWVGTDPLFDGGYFTDMAGVTRGEWGSLDYSLGAESSVRDFYANAITIYGLKQDVGIKDIVYVERVYNVTIDITA